VIVVLIYHLSRGIDVTSPMFFTPVCICT